jgi:hypothetical protein
MKERDDSAQTSGPLTSAPPRIAARPNPGQWADDELLTLVEAATLFWPAGPLTATSLRNAIRNHQLAYVAIAGKFLTTKVAIAKMSVCRRGTDASNVGAGEPRAAANAHHLAADLHDRLYRKRRKA